MHVSTLSLALCCVALPAAAFECDAPADDVALAGCMQQAWDAGKVALADAVDPLRAAPLLLAGQPEWRADAVASCSSEGGGG